MVHNQGGFKSFIFCAAHEGTVFRIGKVTVQFEYIGSICSTQPYDYSGVTLRIPSLFSGPNLVILVNGHEMDTMK